MPGQIYMPCHTMPYIYVYMYRYRVGSGGGLFAFLIKCSKTREAKPRIVGLFNFYIVIAYRIGGVAEESVSESDARGSEREGELVSIANKLIKCLQSLGWPLSTSASALATDSCARQAISLTHMLLYLCSSFRTR